MASQSPVHAPPRISRKPAGTMHTFILDMTEEPDLILSVVVGALEFQVGPGRSD